MTKNWKKNNSWKNFLFIFWSKTAIYLSLGLHKVCPGYRRSLQLTKEPIQHFKTWIFSTFVGHFCPPGSDSVFKLRIRIQWSDWIRIQSGSGSGSETLSKTAPIWLVLRWNPSLQLLLWQSHNLERLLANEFTGIISELAQLSFCKSELPGRAGLKACKKEASPHKFTQNKK